MNLIIRPIEKKDNIAIAQLIRKVLTEFGANKPGTVFTDPTTDHLFELFQTPFSFYLIAELNGEIVGGCGIFPTEGMPNQCIELVKLYVHNKSRNTGLGKQLLLNCCQIARECGYREIYLETLPELHIAVGLYEYLGFEYLQAPYGNSGHFACDLWMRKLL